MKTRIDGAIETIEHFMFMVVDGIVLSTQQKNQIKELLPLLNKNWYNEAIELIKN